MPQPAADAMRYTKIARALALRALDIAIDASAFRPAKDQPRDSMTLAIPAARVLMGADDAVSLDAFVRSLTTLARVAQERDAQPILTDGQGHTRSVYYPLCIHLMLSALALHKQAVVERLGGEGFSLLAALIRPIQARRLADDEADDGHRDESGNAAGQINERLWRAQCELEWSLLTGCEIDGIAAVGLMVRLQNRAAPGGALHTQTPDDTPDAWVYRELTGLHALHLAAQITRDASWAVRCRQVAGYHMEHTQPDYTTYQPWALGAFAEDASTALFAEQQLHDVQSHLAIAGPGGALLPGLLLADAAASLDGRMVVGWSRFRFQG